MNDIAVMLGLGILAYMVFQVADRLNNKDDKQSFVKLLAYFFFFFILMMIPEYMFLFSNQEGFFSRLFVLSMWIMRLLVSVLGILVLKDVFEWVLNFSRRWFGK